MQRQFVIGLKRVCEDFSRRSPMVGALAAIDVALQGFFNPADTGFYALLATLAAVLALLGPAAWSLDARLFGCRCLEIRNGNAHEKRREARPK